MKAVIEGKLFDTAKAEFVCRWDNDLPDDNYHCSEETLYHTPSGQFVLHGVGGPMTRWAQHSDDGRRTSSGESCVVLDMPALLEWLEDRCVDPEVVAEYVTLPGL